MTLADRREGLELAEYAHGLVQTDPAKARGLAEQALEVARRERDLEGQVVALHALGFARSRLGDAHALATMRRAVRLGERGGLHHRASLARRNIAFLLAYRGDLSRALSEVDAARAGMTGLDRARTEVFRIAVYHLAGRTVELLSESRRASRQLRRAGDDAWEARLAYNRGVALGELGHQRAARADLERARDLYRRLGFDAALADTQVKLALLRLADGDPLGCLVELDQVDAGGLSDWARCWYHLHRAEALVDLRLLPEARADLERFSALARTAEADDSLLKARLRVARLALFAGDNEAARALARSARRSFAARGQLPFAASAGLIAFEACLAIRGARPRELAAARSDVELLGDAGWTIEALRGRLLLTRAEAARGAVEPARRELAAAARLERIGTTADRIGLRHAKGATLAASGAPRRAERVLQSGLELLEVYRAALGATEVRAAASMLGANLARLGLELASTDGDPSRMLVWAESLRANALRMPAQDPTSDPLLLRSTVELRLVARQRRETSSSGRAAAALTTRQFELERIVADRSRLLRGRRAQNKALDSTGPEKDSTVIEYVARGDALDALVVQAGIWLERLGTVEVAGELEWLRFALRRLAAGGLDTDGRRAALATAAAAAATLDERLVQPWLHRLAGGPLVVIPTGELHALPWGALPSLRNRAVAVCPSLATWRELSARRARRDGGSIFVSGPGLSYASREARQLAAAQPGAGLLTGSAATVEATLAALDGARVAHIACHGRFRSDNPLFSALELADGPLTALDIQGLRRAPDVLVLSACDVALSERHPGDELLGLSAALLAAGTRTIVASVVPVPDAATRRLMLAFHTHLRAGASPAAALAAAQAGLRGTKAALAGFVCLGAG